jgi:hypothetical protein
VKYAETCPNPWTISDEVLHIHFPAIDEEELPDILKIPKEKKEKLDPDYVQFFAYVTLPIYNGSQRFNLEFSVRRDHATFYKVEAQDDENVDEDGNDKLMDMDNEDDEEKSDDSMDTNDEEDESDESME